jgi:Cytochrome c3
MTRKNLVIFALVLGGALVLGACAAQGPAGPAGPQGPAGPAGPPGQPVAAADLTCTECHNDTTLIVSKEAQFRQNSVHGTGEAFVRGESTDCAGCHGTEGAKARINAGLPPHDPSVVGVTNVSPFDCRTCHNIHTTYTKADFSLTGGEAPVAMEMTGGTYDGGAGNLCANCHQVRNPAPTVSGGNVAITSSRFGPHYGIPAPMLLGEGGLGVTGKPSAHYTQVEDTCVACHMGEEFNHTYLPVVARCQACHADAKNFDMGGTQTEVKAKVDELHAIFVAKKLLNPETDLWGIYDAATGKWTSPSTSAPLTVTQAVANAMWNYKFVVYDKSMGVHNSAYTKALLESALAAMK